MQHAFGYGSAVFSQARYKQQKKDQVVDMILVVDDTTLFHEENLSLNYSHYSGWAKRLPTTVTSSINNGYSGFYFNPNINLSTFIKVFSDQEVMRL